MNAHIVPKVYLKSWKKENSNIFIFQNKNIWGDGRPRNLDLTRSSFAEKDKFTINPLIVSNNRLFTSEFAILFDSLKELNIDYNGYRIESVHDFMAFYPEFGDWKITDKSGKQLSSKKVKSCLGNIWKTQVEKVIETYFSSAIESKWGAFLTYLNGHLLKRDYMVQAQYKDVLIEFMALQICRVFEQIKRLGIDPTLAVMRSLLPNGGPQDIKSYINEKIYDKNFCDSICLTQLFLYTKYVKTGCADYENNIATHIISLLTDMQPIVLVAAGEKRFITSDCPCYHVNLAMKYPKEFTGIYLPVTPLACAYFIKLPNNSKLNKYYIVDVDDDNVSFINYMTIKNSVSSVAYHENCISKVISKKPNINTWKQSFLNIGLAHV